MTKTNQRILIVDDDPEIRSLLSHYLPDNGFDVSEAGNAADALNVFHDVKPDLILLDLQLPDDDGLNLARSIRSESDVPIIIVTGKSEDVDRIIGLELGADDYISKPFNLREVLARIKAVLRRASAVSPALNALDQSEVFSFADWQLDVGARQLSSSAGNIVKLTNIEFHLLLAFVHYPGRVLSREQLLELTRKSPEEVFDRSIDYSIMRLRRKLESDPSNPEFIKTEHGAGYKFTSKVIRI